MASRGTQSKAAPFVNRTNELALLEQWWDAPGAQLAIVWGRRRIGKSRLVGEFAGRRRSVLHIGAARPAVDELRLLSHEVAALDDGAVRDLLSRPFADWTDALEHLAELARDEPLLVVLDEFPELVAGAPELPSVIRAVWERARTSSRLRLLLAGSAVRTMEAMQEERAPLYGRVDLRLLLHPLAPADAARMLPQLEPADRALVWGLLGGVPLYLEWWDQDLSIADNLQALVCTPGGRLLSEGQLVLATEGDAGRLAQVTLRALATGRTRFGQLRDALGSDPSRTLERLQELRLVEQLVPITEHGVPTRRRIYRIADNFLAFWLTLVEPLRGPIESGLGANASTTLRRGLDDFMGDRWEQAFRDHLLRRAADGELGPEILGIGRWWRDEPPVEIDAVGIAGRTRDIVLLGEAKWAEHVDARRLRAKLLRKAEHLPGEATNPLIAIAARREVRNADDMLTVTAADIFTP